MHPGGSGVHAIWDVAHDEQYRAPGVRTVVDLRSEHEIELAPSALHEATEEDRGREDAGLGRTKWLSTSPAQTAGPRGDDHGRPSETGES